MATKKLNYNVIGRRVFAGLLDFALIIFAFVMAAKHWGTVTHTQNASGGHMTYYNLANGPFLVFILAVLAYFTILEWTFGGSLGKLMTGLYVKDETGKNLTFKSALVRNALRVIDAFPYILPNLLGLIILAGNDKKQRLGDKIAHTVVVARY